METVVGQWGRRRPQDTLSPLPLCFEETHIPPGRILYSSLLLLLHNPAIPDFSCRCRLTLHVLTPALIEDLPSALSQATPRGSSNNNSANTTRSSSNSASSRLNRRASTHNIVNKSGKNLGKIL